VLVVSAVGASCCVAAVVASWRVAVWRVLTLFLGDLLFEGQPLCVVRRATAFCAKKTYIPR